MFKLAPAFLSAAAHASIATAHVCDCVAHAPQTPIHHWAAAVAYAVLGFLSAYVLAQHIVADEPPAVH